MDRTCGSMYKNRVRGAPDQGERARNREALVDQVVGGVNAAIVQGRIAFLPGEIPPRARKGDGLAPEREVSRGHSTRDRGRAERERGSDDLAP